MSLNKEIYDSFIDILKEELVPAFGCTEPIAIAYCAAKARDVLGCIPEKVEIKASGNVIKNVKSVVVPNTDGLKGIPAAAAAGIVAGDSSKKLEVISEVPNEKRTEIKEYLQNTPFNISPVLDGDKLEIHITVYSQNNSATVHISRNHCNIVEISKDNEILYREKLPAYNEKPKQTDRSHLSVKNIVEFAETVDLNCVKDILKRQIDYNYKIAIEGLKNDWGANIGKILVKTYGENVKIMSKALAAAGSDARMGGCELPVVINSGSGNQGITVSVPVITYAKHLNSSEDKLYRALLISNLIAIHIKHGIGPLSAFCGAVSAGCAAGCGIAYLYGGHEKEIDHTLVNSLATVSGIFCDGAKASCAAKIASSVEAGILGYVMYMNGQQFYADDGIVSKGVENTIKNVCRLGANAMNETDEEIIRIMTQCD